MKKEITQLKKEEPDIFEDTRCGRYQVGTLHSGPALGKMPDGPKNFEPLEEV